MTDLELKNRYYELKERYYTLINNFDAGKAFSLLSDIEVEKTLYWEEYKAMCDDIAHECVEEGYPSYGSNYELRRSGAFQWFIEWYNAFDDEIEDIQWHLQVED